MDILPAGPKWQPVVIYVTEAQEKRRVINEKASRDPRVIELDNQVGDKVDIIDRHPGWKFRTLFKKETWDVIRVLEERRYDGLEKCVMVRKISCRRSSIVGEESTHEQDDVAIENALEDTGDWTPVDHSLSEPDTTPLPQSEYDGQQTQSKETNSSGFLYQLRSNPQPNQRLRNFV
ncbi:hypothetical protein NDU88_001081 [Pleurodeles waltl]|uniref:Uncharacterized protein n=1 Tax=Pleurodeles waltl TaxID=8319 RepID=A0AAV7TI56_PLEWA|nr:hypothetical protein NDU88_001081 [Pleurodeles waltl]